MSIKRERIVIEKAPVFLNISNTPSTNWSKAQLDAAQTYGKVIDISTPLVPPNLDYQEVTLLAVMYAERVTNEYPGTKVVYITGGESTFDFTLVGILQFRQIPCISPAFELIYDENGINTGEKRFIQFRTYPNFLTLISFNG